MKTPVETIFLCSFQGACVVQGLEEAVVLDKNEVYRILEQGSLRRQTAGTLMNAHSRSVIHNASVYAEMFFVLDGEMFPDRYFYSRHGVNSFCQFQFQSIPDSPGQLGH